MIEDCRSPLVADPDRVLEPARHTGKMAHARVLAELITARYPDRTVHVVDDAAYVGCCPTLRVHM
jgi:hypothetical protein